LKYAHSLNLEELAVTEQISALPMPTSESTRTMAVVLILHHQDNNVYSMSI